MNTNIQGIMSLTEKIAWPLVVMIGLVLFRKQIAWFIERIEKVGKDGIQMTSAKDQEAALTKVSANSENILKPYVNPLLIEQANILKRELDSKNINPSEREEILLNALASNQIVLVFERTYHLIFGSQISLLQRLNSGEIEFKQVFEQAKSKYPQLYSGYTLEEWLGFLISSFLIRNDNGKIGITVRGKEFLKYLIDQNYTLQKFG